MSCGASFRLMDWNKAFATATTVGPEAGEELDEHEIWDAMASAEQSPSSAERNRIGRSQQNPEGFLKQRARVPNAAASSRLLMIPRRPAATDENANANANNARNANPEAAVAVTKSAPMNIPDWSKLRRGNNFHQQQRYGGSDDEDDDDDDDDDDVEMRIPPHELVARQLARSQITSFSVFEGAGRTLKGRDVIRVRNAVLTRTGFLE